MRVTRSEAEMAALGERIAEGLFPGCVIHLTGDLGAGKTTLARAILRAAGYRGEVVSPSFTLIQPYEGPNIRVPIQHVDLYRLARPGDLLEFGLDEAAEEAALIIEWPQQGGDFVPAPDLEISIAGASGDVRELTFTGPEGWERRWCIA